MPVGVGYALDRQEAAETAKRVLCTHMATLALTGMLFLFSGWRTRGYMLTPGSQLPGWWRTSGLQGPGLHFQAILVGGRVHDEVLRDPHLIVPGRFTVSSVTSVTMRSLGEGTLSGIRKDEKLGQMVSVTHSMGHSREYLMSLHFRRFEASVIGSGRDRSSLLSDLQNFWGPPLAFRVKFQVCSVAFNLFLFLGP